MKFNLITLLSFALIALSSISHAQTSYQAPLVNQSLLLDITVANGQVIAVGERGHILRSTDGKNWQQVQVPSISTLTAVNFVKNKGWVVGHDATILHSTDSGENWQVQMFSPDLQRPLLDVLFFDEQHGITIGAYGAFFRTTDGGKNWQVELHPEFLSVDDQAYLEEIKLEDEEFYKEELASILPHLNRVSIFEDTLYLAGEAGLLATSSDFGKSWQKLDIDYYGSFFDIRKTPDLKLIAAGLRGNLFEYQTDLKTWKRIDSGSQSSLNSIVLLANGDLLVVGNNGNLVCHSGDTTEQRQTKDNEAIINAVEFNNQLIAVTAVGIQYLQPSQQTSTCKIVSLN
jgi:photosystem II stability/assembly factor-like uncharacterized protein